MTFGTSTKTLNHEKEIIDLILLIGNSCQKKNDIEADRQALINLTAVDWDKNAMAGNFVANADFYTEDAVRIMPDGKIYSGKESIRTAFKNEIGKLLKGDDKVEDMWISGDFATVRGTYSISFIQSEGGDTINAKGAWVDVCKR